MDPTKARLDFIRRVEEPPELLWICWKSRRKLLQEYKARYQTVTDQEDEGHWDSAKLLVTDGDTDR